MSNRTQKWILNQIRSFRNNACSAPVLRFTEILVSEIDEFQKLFSDGIVAAHVTSLFHHFVFNRNKQLDLQSVDVVAFSTTLTSS